MSAVYNKHRELLVSWALNANAPAGLAYYVIGVDDGYTFDITHEDLSDVPGGSIVITEQALSGITYVNGIIDADNVNLTGLDTSDSLEALIVYLKDGAANSYLAAHINQSTDGSIPQDIDSTSGTIGWHPNGIYRV